MNRRKAEQEQEQEYEQEYEHEGKRNTVPYFFEVSHRISQMADLVCYISGPWKNKKLM
jgi:hypothetical protein